MEPGMEGLFLLTRVGNRFMVAGTFFGIFRISDNKVRPLAKREEFASEYAGADLTTSLTSLVELRRSIR
jgi:hypothetical protein